MDSEREAEVVALLRRAGAHGVPDQATRDRIRAALDAPPQRQAEPRVRIDTW